MKSNMLNGIGRLVSCCMDSTKEEKGTKKTVTLLDGTLTETEHCNRKWYSEDSSAPY